MLVDRRRQPQCGPFASCACLGPFEMRPGEVLPLQIDWTGFLASVPGFTLASIDGAELLDLQKAPRLPADDTDIKLVSGLATDPPVYQAGFFNIIGEGRATEALIWTSPDLPAGRCYRLDLVLG